MLALKPKKKARKAKKQPPTTCRTVRDPRTGRRKKVCKPRKRVQPKVAAPKAAPVPKPAGGLPVPSAAALPVTVAAPARPASSAPAPAPPAAPAPPPAPAAETPPPAKPFVPQPGLPVKGTLSRHDAERLLWRAGFGPRRGEADRLAGTDARTVVQSLTRASGDAALEGAPPRDQNGLPIDPNNVWGHDHVWWLDRMVRSNQPLVERMTLIWHDWFATTADDVAQPLMMGQNATLRRGALGSFLDLAADVTQDPAMLVFLNGIENRRGRPNENYGRELMELFTLGADRGAYTETDVRELARALTGWRADWVDGPGFQNFRFDPGRQDTGVKTLWAGTPHQRSGALGWRDAVRACIEHPLHASFFVRKLWASFISTDPTAETQGALEQLYVSSGWQIRPVVEAILLHPDLYDGPPMVKPPAVYSAGLLRARARVVTTSAWAWRGAQAGQQLFRPPNVSGWKDHAWLDTATIRGRWNLAYEALEPEHMHPWQVTYSETETPAEALASALAFWDRPNLSTETLAELERFAAAAIPAVLNPWERAPLRCTRQNALRHLIVTSPDFQAS